MGLKIKGFTRCLVNDISPSSDDYPLDAFPELVNLTPANSELRRRLGSTPWGTLDFTYGNEIHSHCVIDLGSVDFLCIHSDNSLFIVSSAFGTLTVGTNYPNTPSSMFRIGKHIFIGFDSDSTDGYPMNYILTINSDSTYSIRRAGMADFPGSLLGNGVQRQVSNTGGSLTVGTYKYMFTFATYDETGVIAEGAGFDEFQYSLEATVTVLNSKVNLIFLPTQVLANMPSNATHINIFRSLNINDVWGKDEVYADDYKISPIYPWFRFLGKVSKNDLTRALNSEDGSVTYVDTTPDTRLKNIFDTYDTRGYKPVDRMTHGICTPSGRLFWMDKDIPGRVKFTENAISPNRNSTKYYEGYPEGYGYWYDLNTAGEQNDRGFAISPSGDLLIFQDSRTYAFRDYDPLRTNYLGELKGNPAVIVENSHGCLTNKATVNGPDGRLYVLGNNGYRGFNGSTYDTPDFLRRSGIPAAYYEFMSAIQYRGSLFRDNNNESGVDQILISYPTNPSVQTLDGTLVLVFDTSSDSQRVRLTTYRGFEMAFGCVLPSTGHTVICDKTEDTGLYLFSNGNTDRGADLVQWAIKTKDVSHEDKSRLLFLDRLMVTGDKLPQGMRFLPVLDDVESLSSQVCFPESADSKTGHWVPKDRRRYVDFSADANGNFLAVKISGSSYYPFKINQIDIDVNTGELVQ